MVATNILFLQILIFFLKIVFFGMFKLAGVARLIMSLILKAHREIATAMKKKEKA
jgi:hypothetical protein